MSSDTPKRYDPCKGYDRYRYMEEAEIGEWIRYEDYSAMARELTALRKEREWRPMETAPRDGTAILLFVPTWYQGKGGMGVGLLLESEQEFWTLQGMQVEPSHWLSLPDTQAIAGGESAG